MDDRVRKRITRVQADFLRAQYAGEAQDLGLLAEFEEIPDGLNTLTLIVRFKPQPVALSSAVVAAAVGAQGPPEERATLLALSAPEDRHVHGPAVIALQAALLRSGQAVSADGDFGRNTGKALGRWQVANGFAESGAINREQWQKLSGEDPPSLFDLCLGVTADYEGTSFDRVVGNFDGAGITFGLIGFTLVNGELRRLLQAIELASPAILAESFGGLLKELTEVLEAPKEIQIGWADNISLGPQKSQVDAPWADAFRRIGETAVARRAQMQHAHDRYWRTAQGFLSAFMAGRSVTDLDAALWFDVAVQNSVDNTERADLITISQSNAAGADLRAKFAERIADGSAAKWRKDVLLRKMSFAAGSGQVHGSRYNLAAWGLTGRRVDPAEIQAPSSVMEAVAAAAPRKAQFISVSDDNDDPGTAAIPALMTTVIGDSVHKEWPDYEDFVKFVSGLNLQYFNADELLFLGQSNESGKCAGKNHYPPRALWQNIRSTAGVLDRFRAELGSRVNLLSVFRSADYNACVGGEPNSVHMRFNAIDFRCASGSPEDWFARLDRFRTLGVFRGGLGLYQTFVHLDTRGDNATWHGKK
jgi:hypothetical protein